ncbi:MAG: hypothetical protein HeimC3_53490 [Candidatus Heimdallarchaeota archaeon LC_3]|nr:MAG: hypothetical protein HeimC3_53490 [Candidatus Heimdallarchaeota archaeon LC_3]
MFIFDLNNIGGLQNQLSPIYIEKLCYAIKSFKIFNPNTKLYGHQSEKNELDSEFDQIISMIDFSSNLKNLQNDQEKVIIFLIGKSQVLKIISEGFNKSNLFFILSPNEYMTENRKLMGENQNDVDFVRLIKLEDLVIFPNYWWFTNYPFIKGIPDNSIYKLMPRLERRIFNGKYKKYRLLQLNDQERRDEMFTGGQIKFDGKFLKFHPYLNRFIRAKEVINGDFLINIQSEFRDNNYNIGIALDPFYSSEDYSVTSNYEKIRGIPYSLSKIIQKSVQEKLMVSIYYPNKLGLARYPIRAIVDRRDKDFEIHFHFYEFRPQDSSIEGNIINRYLHSIFNLRKDCFRYISARSLFFEEPTYSQDLVFHNQKKRDSIKLFCIEGSISEEKFSKLTQLFFISNDEIKIVFKELNEGIIRGSEI